MAILAERLPVEVGALTLRTTDALGGHMFEQITAVLLTMAFLILVVKM